MKKKLAAEINELMKQAATEGMTPQQAAELEKFFKMEQHKVTPGPDRGTCVLGNGISVVVQEKGKRRLTRKKIFGNPWTQAEQYEAINNMIDAAKKKYPELADFIDYEPGNMD